MLLATLPLLLITPSHQEQRQDVPWPTQGWESSTPAAEGVEAAVLESIDAEIRAGDFGLIDSMLVIRHGRVVFDRAYEQDYIAANEGKDQTSHQYNYFHPTGIPSTRGRSCTPCSRSRRA